MDEFAAERIVFEDWYKKQFPGNSSLLENKNHDGEYEEIIITAMFGGFIGGLSIELPEVQYG
ncbi:hypothetical protein KAR91_31215 [Candidatus Pacearchaeota archaeon]|nr:hypothetical protein [Candidatus Pacearchaeota archaeon]